MIICGESSGDLNASNLAKKILELDSDIKISGVGGELLRNAGANIFYDIKDLSVIGLFDVLKKLPKFFGLMNKVLQKIKEDKPDAIILVDFSGFNLRLAKKINNTIPVIYYISPQVWASRSGRIKTIQKFISKMIVIFKFEEEFYQKHGVNVKFVGHPLLDIVKSALEKKNFLSKFKLSNSKTTIALLPGSRKQEIKYILPIMLKTARTIAKEINAQFVIAKTNQVDSKIYQDIIKDFKLDIKVVETMTYDCIEAADFCLVASGTATLETALMQKPFAIIYKMNLASYLLYRPQIKVPYIGIVNIIAQREIVPEFIQFRAHPKKIAQAVLEILNNPQRLAEMKNNLASIYALLGEKNASLRAAEAILNFLEK